MSYGTGSEQISLLEKETTVIGAINEYLKMRKQLKKRKNGAEIWILNQFKEYMRKKRTNVYIPDVTLEDFEDFLDSLHVSPKTRANYVPKMRRFQRYIGLSGVKDKKDGKPENPKLVILKLEKKLAKKDKELAEKEEALILHNQTIESQDAKIRTMTERKEKDQEKQCSQCPKIAPLNATINELQSVQYMIDSGEFEKVKQLLAQKPQIEEEIAKGTKIMENQRFVKVRCDMKGGSILSFGNDCMHCKDSFSCQKYYELTNPARA
jgi:uncharacterized coiled-coil protein SlyX